MTNNAHTDRNTISSGLVVQLTYPHVPPRGVLQDADVEVVRRQVLSQAHRLIVGERTFRHKKQTVQLVVNVTAGFGEPTRAALGWPKNAVVAVVQTATVRDDGRSSSGASTGRVPPAEVRTVPAADQSVVVVGGDGSVGLSCRATCAEAAYLDRRVVLMMALLRMLLVMMMVRSCTEIASCATFH